MTRRKQTLKTLRLHLCRFEDGRLVRIAKRERRHAIDRLKTIHAGSFIVTEAVVVDPEESDLGTIYFSDERGDWRYANERGDGLRSYEDALYR